MHAPNKKKLIAATAAPFALTVALGTAPAFAGEEATAEAPATTSVKADKSSGETKTDAKADNETAAAAKAEADTKREAKADNETAATAKAEADTKREAKADNETSAAAKVKAETRAEGGQSAPERDERKKDGGGPTDEGRVATPSGKVRASSSSSAEITVADGCVVESSKDISYVAYYDADGNEIFKTENVDGSTYDLDAYGETYATVAVKAGTSVKTFTAPCDETVVEGGEEQTEIDDDDEVAVGGNGGTEGGTDGEVAAGADVKADADVAAGADVKADADVAAGADVKADADVAAEAGQVAGLESNASAGTSDVAGAGDLVLGAQGGADASAPAYQSAAGNSTGILPNTGAGENAALVAGGAALVGLGGLLMLARRRLGFNS